MTKILTPVGISVLVVIAVVLGYVIFQQQKTPSPNTQPVSTNQPSVAPQSSTDNSTATTPTANQPSAEEIALVKAIPGPSAPIDQRIKYNQELAKYERSAETVEFTNCIPNPFIFRVKSETQFKIKNSDNIQHTIYVGGDKFEIPAESTITARALKADALTNLSCVPAEGGIGGLLHAVE